MREDIGPACDWRDPTAYAALLGADRTIVAWEWLRRTPGYRGAARGTLSGHGTSPDPAGAGAWGLHDFERPELGAPQARPIWRSEVDPSVLAARADSAEPGENSLDLGLLPAPSYVRHSGSGIHLLVSDGLRCLRVDLAPGSAWQGSVRLTYRLSGVATAHAPLLTLRRLLALREAGRFSRSLHRCEPRARRWILMLRASDALASGADQRDIATLLLSSSAGSPRWRSEAPSLRSQVQRLVRSARAMASGGYRDLLR